MGLPTPLGTAMCRMKWRGVSRPETSETSQISAGHETVYMAEEQVGHPTCDFVTKIQSDTLTLSISRLMMRF